jgi:ankyrin repeat protein
MDVCAGKTALHWAVEMAAVSSVKFLVEAGVDVDAKDAKGHGVKDILNAAQPSGIIDRLKNALGMLEATAAAAATAAPAEA